GAVRSMRMALKDARLNPSQLGYVNAHATSTPAGDPQEAHAMRTLLGADPGKVMISSTKSSMGHLLGASGAVEAAICAMAIRHEVIPPTLHLTDPDPSVAGLDLVPNEARRARVDHTLSNSFGFGGTNASLVLSRL
ncbi:MAG: beta-ketoacyl-ACP synthase II, partial [Polyangiales bacterium]